ncbi:hypothetical protein Dimus_017734 [Dionaea muscipula]
MRRRLALPIEYSDTIMLNARCPLRADMEEKVGYMVKLISEEGDSFAKRAEMYYKKRPELINFVEESYRAYRALAERYDHISKELQNANSTLASAFPDQFQFAMEDDDEYDGSPRPPPPRRSLPVAPSPNIPKVPKFPTKNIKAIIALTSKKTQQPTVVKKSASPNQNVPKSGLTKTQALDEIDKLQKSILTKQTEKEFTKSSYESGVKKYWKIEEEITEMQGTVSKLQDEFGIGKVIEDEEARTLMAEAALKSCQETLLQLQEKQERAAAEAKAERQRIKDARDKLLSLKGEAPGGGGDQRSAEIKSDEECFKSEAYWDSCFEAEEAGSSSMGGGEQTNELQMLRDKMKEHLEVATGSSNLTVSEMADKIDKLVNKVIKLQTAVSSQTALIQRLRSETDDLQAQIHSLEGDKADLIDGKNTLSNKLIEMEHKLIGLQDLDRSFESRNNRIQTHFTEAKSNLDHLSENLSSVMPDEEIEEEERGGGGGGGASSKQVVALPEPGKEDSCKEEFVPSISSPYREVDDNKRKESNHLETEKATEPVEQSEKLPSPEKHEQIISPPLGPQSQKEEAESNIPCDEPSLSTKEQSMRKDEPTTPALCDAPSKKGDEQGAPQSTQPEVSTSQEDKPTTPSESDTTQPSSNHVLIGEPYTAASNSLVTEQAREQDDEPNWQQMFMNGLEGKDKVLLAEYTSILRNYKDVKKKLSQVEKKNKDELLELAAQIKELRGANSIKDEEIQSLRQKMSALQKRLEEYKNTGEINVVESGRPTIFMEKDDEDCIKLRVIDQPRVISPAEEKLRARIDEILEENLGFWLRFSTSFHQIQKFQTETQDLQKELSKIEENEKRKKEGSSSSSSTSDPSLMADARAIYKHLGEIQTELTFWIEQSVQLKHELHRRFSQLCNIQEEITRALNDCAEADEMKFTSFQAAKFQGEVLNMQQENNKVADELQAGLDHVTSLQIEVERTIARMDEEFGFGGSRSQSGQMRHSRSGNRVPLRSFIFGVQPKKKKQSIFSCMHPALQRKYQQFKTGDS